MDAEVASAYLRWISSRLVLGRAAMVVGANEGAWGASGGERKRG